MRAQRGIWRGATWGGLVVMLALLSACVGQGDLDAVKQQLSAKELEVTTLQQKAAAAEKSAADAQQKLAAAEKAATAQPKPAAAPSPQPAAASDVTVLIGAVKKAPPPPAPPPAPGAPAAPKPQPPASLFEPVPFAFYVETLASTNVYKYGVASTVACTESSVFKRGMRIIWRFEVFDMSTGKRLTDRDGATIKVKMPNGDEETARFSQRAGGRVPDAPFMWSAAWDIPPDYTLGAFDYIINVTAKDGRTGAFKEPALVGGGNDSRVKIIN